MDGKNVCGGVVGQGRRRVKMGAVGVFGVARGGGGCHSQGMPRFLQAILARRELTAILVQRNLKIRYKGSALGFLWSLLTPAAMILMYAVFAHILKFNTGDPMYLPFLVTGIVVWQFTAGSLNDSLAAIAGNANLVKKVSFPRVILPLSTALANAVNFGLTFVVLAAYLAVSGALHPARIWLLVPAVVLHLALVSGLACLVATANVFYRDTEHIIGVGTLAWFFLSPVFYSLDLQLGALPGRLGALAFLNPMTGILALYRAALMGQPLLPPAHAAFLPPAWGALAISAAVCAAALAAGLAAIRAGNRKFGDVL